VCTRCSIDCSHFAEKVYREAGVPYPYLDTATMLGSSAERLRRNYGLVDLGTDVSRAQAGDLLVYEGHVVMLERTRPLTAENAPGTPRYRGDVVHATGGGAIRTPGEGVQRERFVDLQYFRGPLLRILRHSALASSPKARASAAAAAPSGAGGDAGGEAGAAAPAAEGQNSSKPLAPKVRQRLRRVAPGRSNGH
jgi:hypothetical protein